MWSYIGVLPQIPIDPDCALAFSILTMGPMKYVTIEHEDFVSRLTTNVNKETVECSETSTAQSTAVLITTPSVKPTLIMIYAVYSLQFTVYSTTP